MRERTRGSEEGRGGKRRVRVRVRVCEREKVTRSEEVGH